MRETQVIDSHLHRAAENIAQNNLPVAEAYLQAVLELDAHNAHAWNGLGVIAWKLGLLRTADEWFTRALEYSTNNAGIIRNRTALRQRLERTAPMTHPGQDPAREQFLLIKAWGEGFWSDVDHVLGGLLLAEITGRIPVVHWGKNSRFSDDPQHNAFETFFELISSISIHDLAQSGKDYFPKKWSAENLAEEDLNKWQGEDSRMAGLYFLSRPEAVIVSDFHIQVLSLMPWLSSAHPMHGRSVNECYRYLINKYLRPRPHIVAAVNKFYDAHLGDASYVAVHFRGSDKIKEQRDLGDVNYVNQIYFNKVDAMVPTIGQRIFLLTDSVHAMDAFRARYPDRIVATECLRTSTDTGLHYLANPSSRMRLGIEIMMDTYLAVRAQGFIGNGGSNVSCMICHLGNWKESECFLVSPSMQLIRHAFFNMRGHSRNVNSDVRDNLDADWKTQDRQRNQ